MLGIQKQESEHQACGLPGPLTGPYHPHSAWSLSLERGDQLLSSQARPYLGVPIAIIEIESTTLEACPKLLVILGTKGREQKVRRQIGTTMIPTAVSGPLHWLFSLPGYSFPRSSHSFLQHLCWVFEQMLPSLGGPPLHGPASGDLSFFEKGPKRTWMRWAMQNSPAVTRGRSSRRKLN